MLHWTALKLSISLLPNFKYIYRFYFKCKKYTSSATKNRPIVFFIYTILSKDHVFRFINHILIWIFPHSTEKGVISFPKRAKNVEYDATLFKIDGLE